MDYMVNTEEGQKKLYMMGGLIGNGLKQGMGLQKTGGSKGLNGLISDIIGGFFQGQLNTQVPRSDGDVTSNRQVPNRNM